MATGSNTTITHRKPVPGNTIQFSNTWRFLSPKACEEGSFGRRIALAFICGMMKKKRSVPD